MKRHKNSFTYKNEYVSSLPNLHIENERKYVFKYFGVTNPVQKITVIGLLQVEKRETFQECEKNPCYYCIDIGFIR